MSDSLDLSVRLTRRTATVTTSAPEAAWQRAISWKLRYFPVPTKRREEKVRPAMVRDDITLPVYAPVILEHGSRQTGPVFTVTSGARIAFRLRIGRWPRAGDRQCDAAH